MKWKAIKREDIDLRRWNNCVSTSEQEHIYGYSWFLDAVADNWLGLVLGDYQAVFATPFKNKGPVRYVYQPQFYQRSNVFGSYQGQDIDDLFKKIHQEFSEIDLTSNVPLSDSSNSLRNLTIPDIAHRQYNTNTKRNIAKSKRTNRAVKADEDRLEVAVQGFIQATPHQLQANFKQVFKSLGAALIKHEALEVYQLSDQSNNSSFAVIAKSETKLVLLLLAVSEEARKSGGAHHLIDFILSQYESSTYVFDFEGSENPGLFQFYKGFGADEESYYHYVSGPLNKIKNRFLKKR